MLLGVGVSPLAAAASQQTAATASWPSMRPSHHGGQRGRPDGQGGARHRCARCGHRLHGMRPIQRHVGCYVDSDSMRCGVLRPPLVSPAPTDRLRVRLRATGLGIARGEGDIRARVTPHCAVSAMAYGKSISAGCCSARARIPPSHATRRRRARLRDHPGGPSGVPTPSRRLGEGICVASHGSTIVSLRDGRRSRPWHADVAQLVAHHLAKVRVAGSNPVIRSKVQEGINPDGGVAEW